MGAKRWRLSVTEVGSEDSTQAVTVEADNWMAALRAGRRALGESGGVPTGASCSVSPDGRVSIQDPVARKQYALVPDDGSVAPEDSAAPKDKASPTKEQEAAAAKSAPTPSKPAPAKPVSVAPLAAALAGLDEAPASAKPAKAVSAAADATIKRDSKATFKAPAQGKPPTATPAAGTPVQTPSSPAPAKAAEPAAAKPTPTKPAAAKPAAAKPAAAKPAAAEPSIVVDKSLTAKPAATNGAAPQAAAEEESGQGWKRLAKRDQDPSDKAPITYRERAYALSGDTGKEAAEGMLRARYANLVASMPDRTSGRFFKLAAFDHSWSGRPKSPPIAVLEWKEWRGAPQVSFPVRKRAASKEKKRSTGAQNQKLATAFEACQDLLFLNSTVEGLEFVVKLLEDLIPCEASAASLYDVNDNLFQKVVVRGPGGDAAKGAVVSGKVGLAAKAVGQMARATRVMDPASAGFDEKNDGQAGVSVRDVLLMPVVHQNRIQGMIHLYNGDFNYDDEDVVRYVAEQLGGFISQAKSRATVSAMD